MNPDDVVNSPVLAWFTISDEYGFDLGRVKLLVCHVPVVNMDEPVCGTIAARALDAFGMVSRYASYTVTFADWCTDRRGRLLRAPAAC